MKTTGTWLLLLLLAGGALQAQLQLLPDAQPQAVFGGGTRSLELRWRNAGTVVTNADINAQLFQTSSATAVSLGVTPWKKMTVLPEQTVIESARLEFPSVNAPTKFIVKWLQGTNQFLGQTEVQVYPTNLLGELKTLLNDEPLGVLDPSNQFKPGLKQSGVEIADLEESPLEDSRGKLVLMHPPVGSPLDARNVTPRIGAMVWILPPPKPGAELTPSFYLKRSAKGAIVFAQPDLLARFSESPQAQLNLISLCKLALRSAAATNFIPETPTRNSP